MYLGAGAEDWSEPDQNVAMAQGGEASPNIHHPQRAGRSKS